MLMNTVWNRTHNKYNFDQQCFVNFNRGVNLYFEIEVGDYEDGTLHETLARKILMRQTSREGKIHTRHRLKEGKQTRNVHTGGDLGGGGRDPKKQKESCTTISKRQKQKISSVQDVGVCYIITGTRFPYYISLSTI